MPLGPGRGGEICRKRIEIEKAHGEARAALLLRQHLGPGRPEKRPGSLSPISESLPPQFPQFEIFKAPHKAG